MHIVSNCGGVFMILLNTKYDWFNSVTILATISSISSLATIYNGYVTAIILHHYSSKCTNWLVE
jgi:hypothetical protein